MTIATVAGWLGRKAALGSSTSAPGAKRTGGPAGSNTTPWSPRWMGWHVAQLIAPLASSCPWRARVDPWSPWHPAQARSRRAPAADPRGAASAAPRGPAVASSAWHDAHESCARAWGSESGPGAACPPGGGKSSAAAPVATAPASAAGSTPRKRVTSDVDSARRAARPRTISRGWAARWRGSDRSAR
ncbi:hypothetical protein [Sorangium cellulosum]|uniref:Uncharacterized protein n=1 Tax=Sorangium cellulosum So0157-2 TaxID=1254432 RepID=S4XYV3_SORCE|nr:hypothetical protein [Sorangium cellulosum]AGP37664.1 hypothetical protein SCE1572_26220 [Sorangium cellulosum So0157-2]